MVLDQEVAVEALEMVEAVVGDDQGLVEELVEVKAANEGRAEKQSNRF